MEDSDSPIVIKAVSKKILHKTEQRAVVTNLASSGHLKKEMARLQKLDGCENILVEQMVDGIELIIGAKIVFQNIAHNRPFIGTLYYERISHLSSEVPGLVTKINVRTGDKVDQGSSLIYLDRQILEKEILIQKTRIEQAKLNINHMQKKYHRVESLFEKGTISENDYDDAKFAFKEALLKEKSAGTILEKLLIQKTKTCNDLKGCTGKFPGQ